MKHIVKVSTKFNGPNRSRTVPHSNTSWGGPLPPLDNSRQTTSDSRNSRSQCGCSACYQFSYLAALSQTHYKAGEDGYMGQGGTDYLTERLDTLARSQGYNNIYHLVATHAQSRVLRYSGLDTDTSSSKTMSSYASSHFRDNGYCREHDDYKCSECRQEAERDKSAQALVVVSSTSASAVDKVDALETYTKQTKFIKKALKMSDEKLKAKKVKDIPELLKKAQDEVTIGDMGELLEEEYIPNGFIRGVFNFFERAGKKKR